MPEIPTYVPMMRHEEGHYERFMPEGSYTVEEIVVEANDGTRFVWSDRDAEDDRDDGKRLVFRKFWTEES